ncbi:hypothetical protein ABT297_39775 [Dactylosporangium sp. NPDC000555]|uniref:hypothetical protein n=1 Tax=Dactylosporangium sp. NPDC000555 TaxID=3154260 RepID=UPI0033279B07
MAAAEEYPWKSDIIRVTVAVVAMSVVLFLLDVIWPGTPKGFPRVPFAAALGPLIVTFSPAARSRVRHLIITAIVLLLVALVVLFIADQIRPLHSQPGWAYFLSNALAGWVGSAAAIWVTWLRVKRRHAQAIASSSPSRTTTLDQGDS